MAEPGGGLRLDRVRGLRARVAGNALMQWDGLEYLKIPQWRMAFETADVILGIDVTTGHEILVFGRDALPRSGATSDATGRLQILRVAIDCGSDELELLTAACEIYRGRHDFKSEA